MEALALEELATLSKENLKNRGHESLQHLADPNLDGVFVTLSGHQTKNWRLCSNLNDDEVVDEVVFRLQGIVTKNELVPRNGNKCSARKAIFLNQHVEICGVKTATFEACVRMLQSIHQKFFQQIAGVPIATMVAREGPDGPYFAASNRLFTSRSDVPNEQDNVFEDGVDSVGQLAKLKGTELIHAPDNIVKYYRISKSSKLAGKYLKEIPGAFKVGDLVEMQVSFVAIISNKMIKVTNRLQALTLVDDSFSKTASIERFADNPTPAPRVGVRRRVGYFQEDEEEARAQKKRKSDGGMD
ncbi:hypothetical protein B0H19DRAFT_1061274 [Mycena capillaripes]|nr:hypothetical protein B0H19DRAFT_1061274 [Mycena capillaripes]